MIASPHQTLGSATASAASPPQNKEEPDKEQIERKKISTRWRLDARWLSGSPKCAAPARSSTGDASGPIACISQQQATESCWSSSNTVSTAGIERLTARYRPCSRSAGEDDASKLPVGEDSEEEKQLRDMQSRPGPLRCLFVWRCPLFGKRNELFALSSRLDRADGVSLKLHTACPATGYRPGANCCEYSVVSLQQTHRPDEWVRHYPV
ncbi:hypothetical protein TgHK011_009347 [Trichoderma gracile]|nr:hypothetical protein TgHK011_009347 [Trichoderma gracile]